ncbi:Type II/IV secretion system protein [Candidatus Gugararchaeum adminiculabundum]|nr:Type II/IV secretion system protein [Candidatus Gugararchaeum adminiculabundum]
MIIRTEIDDLCELAEKGPIAYSDISKKFGWKPEMVDEICEVLEKRGIIKRNYPMTVVQQPRITLLKKLPRAVEEEEGGKLVDSYYLKADRVPGKVVISASKRESRPTYNILIPVTGAYTAIFLEHLKDRVAEKVSVETQQLLDVKMSDEIKHQFEIVTAAEVAKYFGKDAEKAGLITGILLHSMYGLGNIEVLMADDMLEEIIVNNAATPISVYHRRLGWLKTNIYLSTEDDIANYSSQIGRKVGRQITVLEPILDAHLMSGDRACATLFPISSRGNTLTIRRFARDPWTMINFFSEEMGSLSIDMAALIWQAIHFELNMIVAGGTASGKTSMLNSMCALIPPHQRVVTIEDTRELMFPSHHWNWVPLTTREANAEGVGQVDMLNLLIHSLRMRPDRIVLGEIRKREEAEVLFEAMHTGHAVYSTLHADTASQVLRRMTQPPMEIPEEEMDSLHLLVVQYRDRRKNIRRTLEISEVTSGGAEGKLGLNRVWLWRPREDSFQKFKEPTKMIEALNLHTGMTEKEIARDLKDRNAVLSWMQNKKLDKTEDVGKVMSAYYASADEIIDAAYKNLDPAKVFQEKA